MLPWITFAHEAYVLTPQEFQAGLQVNTLDPLKPLLDISHLGLFTTIFVLVALSYILVILFSATKVAQLLDQKIKKLNVVGPFLIRLAVSSAFFYGSLSDSILGPELLLRSVAGGEAIKMVMLFVSVMIFTGTLVEVVGLLSLLVLIYVSSYFGVYMITYANYFAEVAVLMLFGSRVFSVDRLLFGKKSWSRTLEKLKIWEVPLVRIFYGVALAYAGYTIKFQHQLLTVMVYNNYHLEKFFHSDASFIAAGAGLSEITIGLFIILGFCQRWTVFISLVFITLSILYFKEMVWPHFLLYGISLSLIINSADFLTIDKYLPHLTRRLFFSKR